MLVQMSCWKSGPTSRPPNCPRRPVSCPGKPKLPVFQPPRRRLGEVYAGDDFAPIPVTSRVISVVFTDIVAVLHVRRPGGSVREWPEWGRGDDRY